MMQKLYLETTAVLLLLKLKVQPAHLGVWGGALLRRRGLEARGTDGNHLRRHAFNLWSRQPQRKT